MSFQTQITLLHSLCMQGRGAAPSSSHKKTRQVPQLGCLSCTEDLTLLLVPVALGRGERGADEHFPTWSFVGGIGHLLLLNKAESAPLSGKGRQKGLWCSLWIQHCTKGVLGWAGDGLPAGNPPCSFHPQICIVWHWAAQSMRKAGWMRAAEMLLAQQGMLSP